MSILAKKKTAESESDLAEILRAGGSFVIEGGGTRRIGVTEGESLSTQGVSGVTLYEPGTLTLVAQAGTSVAEIDTLLASERQRLAFEAPDLRGLLGREGVSTLGGVVATNASGPRRVAMGACRDFCLGVRFIDGRGEVVKNGGRVMKNVTGLDLVKLMAGSHGTLGVMTEVSLKVQPLPETVVTLVVPGCEAADAIAILSQMLGQPYDLTGASWQNSEVLLRLEGFETSLRYRVERLKALLRHDVVEHWGNETCDPIWHGIRDVTAFHDRPGDVWSVSVKPSAAVELVDKVMPDDVMFDWGGNRIWLLTETGTDVRAKMTTGHATLIRASEETKQNLGVFHPQPAALARISAGLRQTFDPEGKFNRGMR
ncbi:FAD-binding protein [Celeribacter sp. PS-C1]|uniref:FAD-binding protein n=1 Tax=Celeribacter sp. PS-C1 TaxID=2820813 RepID=UPI001CA49CA1|nr:FAD-binding protein [Celeribacter sp. PS-C1]MBW6419723.1 FAD-binding protein [Celeribacter sp. PS-C1]